MGDDSNVIESHYSSISCCFFLRTWDASGAVSNEIHRAVHAIECGDDDEDGDYDVERRRSDERRFERRHYHENELQDDARPAAAGRDEALFHAPREFNYATVGFLSCARRASNKCGRVTVIGRAVYRRKTLRVFEALRFYCLALVSRPT